MTPAQLPAELDESTYVIALSELPGIGPRHLLVLLSSMTPSEAWDALSRGKCPDGSEIFLLLRDAFAPATELLWRRRIVEKWIRATRSIDVVERARPYSDAGITAHYWRGPGYPDELSGDDAAAVFFAQGPRAASLPDLPPARVAIVGTRTPSPTGLDAARSLASDLSASGVSIVSGLARGIDSAGHAGALAAECAPPIAVVGSGLDVIYPRSSASAWSRIRDAGLLVSEYPLGAPPRPRHFPERNRVIAALSHVVVIVESHETGGALSTATEASKRSIPVMAVPGSLRNPAARGTNHLIYDGCAMARDAQDILTALALCGVDATGTPGRSGTASSSKAYSRATVTLTPLAKRVLDAIEDTPVGTEHVLERCPDARTGDVAMALENLESAGLVVNRGGWWLSAAR